MSESFRESIQQPSDRIIVALDNMRWLEAESLVEEVHDSIGMAKANSIAQRKGWAHAINSFDRHGAQTMADAKFHDIPETVRLQTQAVTEAGARLITVHASGGRTMLEKAVEGRNQGRENAVLPPQGLEKEQLGGILGITVLTSLSGREARSIYGISLEKKVLQFAHMAVESGIDGIVCSGKELKAIRKDKDLDDLVTVVPGITPEWTKKAGDQKRIVTPTEAVQSGADYIVVGRAITQPPEGISRPEAAARIAEELSEA